MCMRSPQVFRLFRDDAMVRAMENSDRYAKSMDHADIVKLLGELQLGPRLQDDGPSTS